MYFPSNMPSWTTRTEVKTGRTKVIYRDEFPDSKTISEIVEYIVGCKKGDVINIRVKKRDGDKS